MRLQRDDSKGKEHEEDPDPVDVAFDLLSDNTHQDTNLILERDTFDPAFLLIPVGSVPAFKKHIVDDAKKGRATVFDFDQNGIQLRRGLSVASVSIYEGASPFDVELRLVGDIKHHAQFAHDAIQVLALTSETLSDKIGHDAAVVAEKVVQNAILEKSGLAILDKAKAHLESIWFPAPVPRTFLERLHELYYKTEGNQLSPLLHILDYMRNYTGEQYHASFDHSVRGVPLVWFAFSIGVIDDIKVGERGFMKLYGWSKSLLGMAEMDVQQEKMPVLGVFALSLIADIASHLLNVPLSFIFLESLIPTDVVIDRMRDTCGISVPLVYAEDIGPLEIQDDGGPTPTSADVILVTPEFRNCWKMFTASHHPVEKTQKRLKKTKAPLVGCDTCKIAGVQLYTADGDRGRGVFCSAHCIVEHG